MATADERNFRSSYYEKVGFRSVEEKKSLEILLKERPLDTVKLKQFCLRFTVPCIYKNFVWKILLSVLPAHVVTHEFVMEQREQQYNDIVRALKLMKIVDDSTPKPTLFIYMWLIEKRNLRFNFSDQIKDPLYCNLSRISLSLCQMFENDVDTYWISKGFYECVLKFYDDIPQMIRQVKTILEKEDAELYRQLLDMNLFDCIPLHDWLCACFSGIIDEAYLSKIWDKLIGGSCKILVYVAVVLLISLKWHLKKGSDKESLLTYLDTISDEVAEKTVNKAIELWHQQGTANLGSEAKHVPVSRQKAIA